MHWEQVSWAVPGMPTGTQVAHCALQSLSRLTVMAAAVSGPHSGHEETGAGLLAVSFLLHSGHTGIPREVARSDLLPHRPRGSRVRQGIRLQTGLPGSAGFFLWLEAREWRAVPGQNCTQPVPGCAWLEAGPVDLVKSPQMSAVGVVAAGLG